MREPKRFVRFSNPEASHDGKHFAVVVEAEDNSSFDIEVPIAEIGTIVEYLVSAGRHVNPLPFQGQPVLSPIPVQGLGFAPGHTPAETLLVVRLAGFDLAFALDSSKLKLLAHDVAHTAQALSAHTDSPH